MIPYDDTDDYDRIGEDLIDRADLWRDEVNP